MGHAKLQIGLPLTNLGVKGKWIKKEKSIRIRNMRIFLNLSYKKKKEICEYASNDYDIEHGCRHNAVEYSEILLHKHITRNILIFYCWLHTCIA